MRHDSIRLRSGGVQVLGLRTIGGLIVSALVLLLFSLLPFPVSAGHGPTLEITENTTFTEDFTGHIVIAADDITLDCAGYNVTGFDSGIGIFFSGRTGVTVKNCLVRNFESGFTISSSSGNILEDNEAQDNGGSGFVLDGSSGNTLQENTATGNGFRGFELALSSGNTFTGNTANGNGDVGFLLSSSSVDNTLTKNTATGNGVGFFLSSSSGNTFRENTATGNGFRGFGLALSSGNTFTGNTANGNGVGFLLSSSSVENTLTKNTATDSASNGFFLSSSGNTLTKNTAEDNGLNGIVLVSSDGNNTLENNTATGNVGVGFFLSESSSNTLTKNTAEGNGLHGFFLESSSGNTLEDNEAIDSTSNGFFLFSSIGNTIEDNEATGNANGFFLFSSIGNTIEDNEATGNAFDGFQLGSSPDNILTKNTAEDNVFRGFALFSSSGNTIFHNNIIDNTVQAVDSNPTANDWHHPVLEEGNFWSDYTGADDGSGTGKHAIAGDGIGDTLIPHPRPGFDNYPLIDNTPPATTASQSGTFGQAGWFRSAVGVALSAADDQSGVTSTFYRIDGGVWLEYASPFTVEGDGIHTVEYNSTDVAGNAEDVKSVDVRIDTVAPETSFSLDGTLGQNGWYVSTVTVTLAASDATSGVASISYRIGGGAQQEYTNPFRVDGDGTHTVEYFSTDVAGNAEAVKSFDGKIDTTPPTLSISFPAAGAFLAAADVEVAWTAADATSGIDHFEVSLDDGTPVVLPATTTSHAFTGLAEGAHTIAVKAFDIAGNSRPVAVGVTVDTTPPTLSLTSPASGAIGASSSVEVTWVAADATSGIDHFEVTLDGGMPVILPATATSHTFTGVADGAHTVTLTAFDVAGNSVVFSVDLTVDTNILSLTGPYGSGPLIGTSVGIIVAAIAVALLILRSRGKRKGEG